MHLTTIMIGKIRFSIILVAMFSGLTSFGQDHISLNWDGVNSFVDENNQKIWRITFDGADHRSNNNFMPSFNIKCENGTKNLTLSNTTYDILNPVEAQYIDQSFTSSEPIIEFFDRKSRGATHRYAALTPFRVNESGAVERLLSFDIEHSSDNEIISKSSFGQKTQELQPSSSVLSSGYWYKVAIQTDGIYKFDKNALSSMGFNVNELDPRKIKVYGNGGGMLPQANSSERHNDLVENAVFVSGENDGSFDSDDYILFYGQGPHQSYIDNNEVGHHNFNLYSDFAYYFVTISDDQGKRIETAPVITATSNTYNSFQEYKWHEKDLENLLISGREWYGENFEFDASHSFDFNVEGVVSGTNLSITTALMAQSKEIATTFSVSADGNDFLPITIQNTTPASYGIKGREVEQTNLLPVNQVDGSNLTIKITHNKLGNQAALGFVNYLGITYERELKIYDNQTIFTQVNSTVAPTAKYEINTTNDDLKIWNVTKPENINALPYTVTSNASFTDSSSQLKRYVAFTGNNFPAPTPISAVANQDLHGITTAPEILIVYHPDFKSAAEDLADFKRSEKGFSVVTANVFEIYNEFSSGAQDISAIRDFTKMLYDRGNEDEGLRFLILFGDASYDYKNRVNNNTNFIPIYESYESLHNVQTYSSDDFFGFLEEDEGTWSETGSGNHTLDIGVGRFVTQTISQANSVVNKIKHYSNNEEVLGKWRNEIVFVADDGDGTLHMDQADVLAEGLKGNHPDYNINKLFLDAFEQVSSASGEIAPVVNDALSNQIANGVLIVNYTGHGGETGWTQEQILTVPQIESWENFDKLPLFVTATCEFGRYDDPERSSGGEILQTKADGGAIALVTTTRPVYSSSNFNLNTAFYNYALSPKSDSTMRTIGEVQRDTKNNSLNSVFNRNFSLLGDPSLQLAYPEKEIVITTVNDTEIDATSDTISALGKVTIKGEVKFSGGSTLTDFNGVLSITVYDKESSVTSLGNEKTNGVPNIIEFVALDNILYEGTATIQNGLFQFSFVVPKDISYQFDKGKISLYAQHTNGIQDANGAHKDLVIGGTAASAPIDNTPPEIKLYMDDLSFIDGGNTGENTTLIAKLYDDNGINTARNGIGHEISASIDGGPFIILNDFYVAEIDEYRKGTVTYKFKGLSDGPHTIRFKAWDTHNNSAIASITFWVGGGDFTLSNAPNPFIDETIFYIDHDRAGEDLDLEIVIYDEKGQEITILSYLIEDSPSLITEVNWDGTGFTGNKLGSGIYFYRTTLRYVNDGQSITKIQRLTLIN